MAIKLSVSVRNARLNAIETTISTDPTLEIRSGSPPTNVDDADSGTLLATLSLPTDWMAAASGGVKGKSGTWQDSSADGTGEAGHFRIKASDTTVHIQGTVSESGGGGDMILDNTDFAAGQTFTITQFDLTDGNDGGDA